MTKQHKHILITALVGFFIGFSIGFFYAERRMVPQTIGDGKTTIEYVAQQRPDPLPPQSLETNRQIFEVIPDTVLVRDTIFVPVELTREGYRLLGDSSGVRITQPLFSRSSVIITTFDQDAQRYNRDIIPYPKPKYVAGLEAEALFGSSTRFTVGPYYGSPAFQAMTRFGVDDGSAVYQAGIRARIGR